MWPSYLRYCTRVLQSYHWGKLGIWVHNHLLKMCYCSSLPVHLCSSLTILSHKEPRRKLGGGGAFDVSYNIEITLSEKWRTDYGCQKLRRGWDKMEVVVALKGQHRVGTLVVLETFYVLTASMSIPSLWHYIVLSSWKMLPLGKIG